MAEHKHWFVSNLPNAVLGSKAASAWLSASRYRWVKDHQGHWREYPAVLASRQGPGRWLSWAQQNSTAGTSLRLGSGPPEQPPAMAAQSVTGTLRSRAPDKPQPSSRWALEPGSIWNGPVMPSRWIVGVGCRTRWKRARSVSVWARRCNMRRGYQRQNADGGSNNPKTSTNPDASSFNAALLGLASGGATPSAVPCVPRLSPPRYRYNQG